MLSAFVEDNQSNWGEILPYVMMAIRSNVQSFTPYKALLSTQITCQCSHGNDTQYVSGYAQKLPGYLSTVRKILKISQKHGIFISVFHLWGKLVFLMIIRRIYHLN